MKAKKQIKKRPEVHKELEGFEIKIDSFGQLQSSFKIENLRKFLDDKMDDKKLIPYRDDREEE